jgi:hypothetical protein
MRCKFDSLVQKAQLGSVSCLLSLVGSKLVVGPDINPGWLLFRKTGGESERLRANSIWEIFLGFI